jgi:hypothetical protein
MSNNNNTVSQPNFDLLTPSSVRITQVYPIEGSCLGFTEVTIEGEGLGYQCTEVTIY